LVSSGGNIYIFSLNPLIAAVTVGHTVETLLGFLLFWGFHFSMVGGVVIGYLMDVEMQGV